MASVATGEVIMKAELLFWREHAKHPKVRNFNGDPLASAEMHGIDCEVLAADCETRVCEREA